MILSMNRSDCVSQITPVSVNVIRANGPANWIKMYRVMLRMGRQYTRSPYRDQCFD